METAAEARTPLVQGIRRRLAEPFASFMPVLPSIAWEKLRSLDEGAAATRELWS